MLMFNGADEIFADDKRPFASELPELRRKYPEVICTISSRSHIPSPAKDLETVNLTPPTEEEIREIQRRLV